MDSKKLKKMVFILGFMAFWVNGDNYAAAPLLIDIARDLQIEIGPAALSVTAYMLAFGLLTIIFGPLGDRYGKTRIIKVAAFGTAIFSILGAFVDNLLALVIIRALNGSFAAGILPVAVALVGENSPSSQRQNMIGKLMGMMFLGGVSATVIGGLLTYFDSWRLVYGVYGFAELLLALAMFRILEKSSGTTTNAHFARLYKEALSHRALVRTVSIMFLIGFCVLGSFTYTGKFIQNISGYNILTVGLILSLFGIGTVVGGRKAGAIRDRLGHKFFLFTGISGGLSLMGLSSIPPVAVIAVLLFLFGASFILFQSTLIMTAQEILPKLRGTVMSLASFNMVVGGAVGTLVNGQILKYYGMESIYIVASILFVTIGILANANIPHTREVREMVAEA